MATIDDALAAALRVYQSGNLPEAERLYCQILAADPRCGEAWHMLSGIAQQSARFAEAADYVQRAVELMPESAGAHSDLGTALQLLGRPDEAIVALKRALQLEPNAEVLHFNLGNAFRAKGNSDEAIACFRRATELNANFVEANCNLAATLQEVRRFEEAFVCCREVLTRSPKHAAALTILGNVFKSLERMDDAAACYQQALAVWPDFPEALSSLGSVLELQGRLEEAIACSRRAIEIRPNYASGYNSLGTALEQSGDLQAALDCFSRAIELDPRHAEAHLNRSAMYLLAGDFERGWEEYEWRWRSSQMRPRDFAAPAWQGESLVGKTILIHAEQGLGDMIQFIRYVPLVKQLGANVLVECRPPLMNLISTCRGIDHLIPYGQEFPPHDVQAPLLSLPRIFKTTLATVPAEVPYLSADQGRVEDWRQRLAEIRGFRIGLNWHGHTGHGDYQRRQIPASAFSSLSGVPGVRFISLQKGASAAELAAIGGNQPVIYPGDDLDQTGGAFIDTAAIMMNLNLVITNDTAISHLAGTLGVPVWLLLPFLPDWRWLLDREDSPWYPTMRIFRQTERGNWTEVVDCVLAALRSVAAA